MVMVRNILYTPEYGYGMKHPVLSEYGNGMEHSVYIRVWLWYGTICIHQSMVMIRNTLYTPEYGYGMEHRV